MGLCPKDYGGHCKMHLKADGYTVPHSKEKQLPHKDVFSQISFAKYFYSVKGCVDISDAQHTRFGILGMM